MELYQLRTFAAVAEAGSLTRAAKKLHLSQPAASAQIKALEEELGVPLFERRPAGLVLTRTGSALLPEAQRILALTGEFATHARRLRGLVSGKIRFGAIFDPALVRLGELMSRMIECHPMLEIEIHHRNSLSVIDGVRQGELDAGMALGKHEIPGIGAVPLKRIDYRIVAPTAWGAKLRRAPWREIAALPWISTPKHGSHFQMASEIFRRHGFEPVNVIEADSELVIASLVAAGVGLGLMREDLALEAHAQRKIVALDAGRAQTLLRLVFPSRREDDPMVKAILDVVRQLWPRAPAACRGASGKGAPRDQD